MAQEEKLNVWILKRKILIRMNLEWIELLFKNIYMHKTVYMP